MNPIIQNLIIHLPKEQLLLYLMQLLQELAKKTDNDIDDALVFVVCKVLRIALRMENTGNGGEK